MQDLFSFLFVLVFIICEPGFHLNGSELTKESDDSFMRLAAGFVPARLPFSECALVNAQQFLVFDSFRAY